MIKLRLIFFFRERCPQTFDLKCTLLTLPLISSPPASPNMKFWIRHCTHHFHKHIWVLFKSFCTHHFHKHNWVLFKSFQLLLVMRVPHKKRLCQDKRQTVWVTFFLFLWIHDRKSGRYNNHLLSNAIFSKFILQNVLQTRTHNMQVKLTSCESIRCKFWENPFRVHFFKVKEGQVRDSQSAFPHYDIYHHSPYLLETIDKRVLNNLEIKLQLKRK